MTTPGASAFSLRPWPIADKKPKNLGEFIARINAERGGFRNVTEAKLREEIAAQQDGRVDAQGADDSSEEEEEEADADKSQNAVAAREEFLKNIEFAHQSAMLSLDFVSLLLSKETPVQAGTTLSTALRDLVGIGTLGASKLKDSNVTETRKQDDLAVATGWRVMGIDNMVDSVVASAEKLEKEIELETKYWADVLDVSESSWAICALPHERHTLGVRFGFAESATEFRNSSIAPLRRNDDGTVRLDLGRVGGGSQRIRVTLKKNGRIVDQSPLQGRILEDAPLRDRVLEARNTIFHQELWYELNREARTLLSSNVYSDASTITWKQDEETDMIFTLEDLGEPDNTHEHLYDVGCSCTAYYLYMQFLLFQGHRQNYHKRTTMTQPQNPRMAMHQPYAILRAVIANAEYFRDCNLMADFLEDLVFMLRRAGISTASCKSIATPLGPTLQGNPARRNAKMELNFINFLAGRLNSVFELTITPEAKIFARGHIILVPYIGMSFHISLTPFPAGSSGNNGTPSGAPAAPAAPEDDKIKPFNPLEHSYPPVDLIRDPYPSAREAIYYVRQAAIRAVVQHLADEATAHLARDDIGWAETVRGPGIMDRDEEHEVRLDIASDGDGRLMLSLDAQWPRDAEKKTTVRRWTWKAHRGDDSGESIVEAVVRAMRGGAGA
ncbi:RNA polymerase II mediator complex subunit [Parahypoxylon ruwenzoriense]